MAIYDFFLSRNNAATITAENYVGHVGRLFYDDTTGVIKLSDGVTAGGLSIPYTIATDTVIGGVKAGPGVTINAQGQILIDSADLSFSFGDFEAVVGTYAVGHPDAGEDYALLRTVHANEDIVFASNGTGVVKVLGEFSVSATSGTGIDDTLLSEPVFQVKADGQIRMLVPLADEVAGAFEIIGNTTGAIHPPTQTGVIIHTTGNTGITNRVYHDANNNYPIIVGRRYNGTVGNLTQVLNNEVIFRIAGQASTGTGFETFGPAKINWMATEDQGPNNQGGKITIDVTANGTAAFGNAVTALEITATGIVSTVGFVGDLTGNVTIGSGNTLDVTGATVTGLTFSGFDPADIAGTMTGTTIKSTVTGSSLTSVGTLTGLTVSGTIGYTVAQNNATVTQLTDKSTAVTANGRTGQITTTADSIAAGRSQGFTVNNTAITAATDVVVVNIASGATANNYQISVTAVAPGSFRINLSNVSNTAVAEALVINFAIINVS